MLELRNGKPPFHDDENACTKKHKLILRILYVVPKIIFAHIYLIASCIGRMRNLPIHGNNSDCFYVY